MALVDGFLELERSSGKLEWSAILQKMASDLGFSKILFGLLPKDSQDYENAFIVGNYPAAWREHYDRAGYARVDPTVSHCTQSVLPIFWEPSIYQTRKQHEFFEEASAAARGRRPWGRAGGRRGLGTSSGLRKDSAKSTRAPGGLPARGVRRN